MKGNIKNAIISNVTLEINDRGILDFWLMLDFGGSSQGFGGYTLYLPKSFDHHQLLSHAGHFIYRSLEVASVKDFSSLTGKAIRADADLSRVYGIGHIVKNDWFYPEDDFNPVVDAEFDPEAKA